MITLLSPHFHPMSRQVAVALTDRQQASGDLSE
jgi:hypothetical protein